MPNTHYRTLWVPSLSMWGLSSSQKAISWACLRNKEAIVACSLHTEKAKEWEEATSRALWPRLGQVLSSEKNRKPRRVWNGSACMTWVTKHLSKSAKDFECVFSIRIFVQTWCMTFIHLFFNIYKVSVFGNVLSLELCLSWQSGEVLKKIIYKT